MKRLVSLVMLAAALLMGGCATSKEPDSASGNQWEYRTVTLEAPSMGQIDTQLHQWNMQGWQAVNPYVNVTRMGLGYRATIPMRRLKQMYAP